MEKIASYILLFAALTFVLLFGGQTIKLPDSFAKRGTLPRLNEWLANQ
jgi:hypothetical protein